MLARSPIDWLLQGAPWVVYRTLRDLCGEPDDAPAERTSRANRSDDGIYILPLKITENDGGSGVAAAAWAPCDAPVTVSALARMGLGKDPDVLLAREALMATRSPTPGTT